MTKLRKPKNKECVRANCVPYALAVLTRFDMAEVLIRLQNIVEKKVGRCGIKTEDTIKFLESISANYRVYSFPRKDRRTILSFIKSEEYKPNQFYFLSSGYHIITVYNYKMIDNWTKKPADVFSKRTPHMKAKLKTVYEIYN